MFTLKRSLRTSGVAMSTTGEPQGRSAALKSGAALVISLFVTEVFIVCTSPALNGRRLYEYWILSLFSIIGATVGWFLGIVVSPRNQEDKRFAVVGSAIATFFSGFLVSKLNEGYTSLLNAGPVSKDLPDHATLWIRLAFSVAWFMVALTITFLTRTDELNRERTPDA